MKILITGISGFVARHFVEYLSTTGESHDVAGVYFRHKPNFNEFQFPNVDCSFHRLDLREKDVLTKLLADFQPAYILHLASQSSVAYSWLYPAESMEENNSIFLNLIEQTRLSGLGCRILSVGSSEEYGHVKETDLPLVETQIANPVNPYGASRAFQQMVSDIYCRNYGLDIIHTRSFNHLGPYQTDKFVVSSFAKQVANELKDGRKNIKLSVGNVDIVRDFTDVRDVVQAYYLLLQSGTTCNIYNVCSGQGFVLKDIISMIARLTNSRIDWCSDENNIRPSENKKMIGSHAKLTKETGWQPKIPLEQSLRDLIEYWSLTPSLA